MDLMGLLLRHHCTTKVKIKSPLQSKFKRRMEGETFQESMNASSEKPLMQKLLENVEAQGEVLKKIISRLSKMEEYELMEGEEWDEGDKVDYEQSK